MNNDQFRKLIAANAAKSSKDGPSPSAATPGGSALGSRQRANIPMTPRSLGGAQADFARQMAERNRVNRPQKKFKSSAPKGVRIADGYVDRTADREDKTADDRADRIKALEESLKKEEIDQATFDKLRLEIAGGDMESTHLVKGLDFKLLKRIREGEDVYEEKKAEAEPESEPEDVDDAFDQLEQQDVEAVAKAKTEKKKGELSTVKLAPGKKRTRDQIMAELKASREAAKQATESSLGPRFRKIGTKKEPGSRIERDSKGREVLIIVNEDGIEKRKVRKVQPGTEPDPKEQLLMPDPNVAPLGVDFPIPEQYRKKEEPEEDEDMDIFEGVGDDYDPLAGMDGSDSDSEDDSKETKPATQKSPTEAKDIDVSDKDSMPPPPKPKATKPNYFEGAKTGLVSQEEHKAPSMDDPAIQAAIKRAAALKKAEGNDSDDDDDDEAAREKKAREARHKKMLQNVDRDDEDMDMGFGTSRFEDEEDFDESKVKLSNWGQDDDGGEGQQGKGAKRKRGAKKRKGDGNNAADVLRVMESRKSG